MQVRPKLGPLRDFGVEIIILLKHEMAPFGKKRSPKSPLFETKLLFILLDDQVDTISFIFSPKFFL